MLAAPAPSFEAKLANTQYKGWKAYRLTNGLISLYVTPEIGGRAIQLELGDQSYFFVNKQFEGKILPEGQDNLKSGWANYGGDKVWPAPEGWMNDDEWPSIQSARFPSPPPQSQNPSNYPRKNRLNLSKRTTENRPGHRPARFKPSFLRRDIRRSGFVEDPFTGLLDRFWV